MSGHLYGESAQLENCPYCNTVCVADFVDIGVGYTQCGPYHCTNCHASEIGPYDEKRELTKRENDTGWYEPESGFGSSANVIGGRVVTHRQIKETYAQHFTNNPLWEDKEYVDEWWEKVRK